MVEKHKEARIESEENPSKIGYTEFPWILMAGESDGQKACIGQEENASFY